MFSLFKFRLLQFYRFWKIVSGKPLPPAATQRSAFFRRFLAFFSFSGSIPEI